MKVFCGNCQWYKVIFITQLQYKEYCNSPKNKNYYKRGYLSFIKNDFNDCKNI